MAYGCAPTGTMRSPYAVLGVPVRAELSVIKAAHRRLAAALHPDRNPDGAARMAEVNVAWDRLSNSDARRVTDLVMLSPDIICTVCKGTGLVHKQRGFKAVFTSHCAACHNQLYSTGIK